MERTYVECSCYSDEHVLRFTYDPDDKEIYTSVFLNDWEPWYKRVWKAVKYVFGYKSKYGHFDCTLIRGDEARKLRDLCNKALGE